RGLLDVANFADDGHPRRGRFSYADVNALADGILAGPVVIGECAIDDDHQRRFRVVGFSKEAAANERDTRSVEIVAEDLGGPRKIERSAFGGYKSFGDKSGAAVVA